MGQPCAPDYCPTACTPLRPEPESTSRILSNARPLGCSMYAEHRAAALERRPPNLSPVLAQLESCASRITAVGARIGANTLDPRVLPISARLLALPPAVHMMQVGAGLVGAGMWQV